MPLPRPARILRLALLATLSCALVVGLLGMRWLVETRMAAVRDSIMLFLQQKLERNISFGRLSPSVFGRLTITDLKVYSRDDPQRVIFGVSRLRADYSLLKLLLTRRPLEALREINLTDSVLTLDWEADHELVDVIQRLTRPQPGAPAGPGGLGAAGLRVTGTNLTIDFFSDTIQVGLSRLSFALSGGGPSLELSLSCGVVLDLSGGGVLAGHLETMVDIRGTASVDQARADLEVQIRSLVHDRLALRDQTFLVAYRDGTLTATKIEDRAPVDLELVVQIPQKTARLSFQADTLRLGDLLSLRGDWAGIADWLRNPVTARGALVLDLEGGQLGYELELSTRIEDKRLPEPVSLSATVRGDGRTAGVESLEAMMPSGTLRFTGDLDLSTLMPKGEVKLDGFASLLGRPVRGTVSLDRLQGRPGVLSVEAEGLSLGTLGLRRVGGEVDLDARRARLSLLGAWAPVLSGEPEGTADLAARIGWSGAFSLELSGRLEEVSVGSLVDTLSPREQRIPQGLRGYALSGSLDLTTDLKAFALDVPDAVLRDPANTANGLEGAFHVANDHLEIRSLGARYAGQRLAGNARVELSQGRAVGFRSSFALNDVPFEVTGALEQNDLRFTGSYGIQGAILMFPVDNGRQDLYFRVTSGPIPVPVSGVGATAALNLRGVFPEEGDWFVTSDGSSATLDLKPTRAGSGPTQVSTEMDFILDRAGVTFERVVVKDRVSSVTGAGTVVFLDPAALKVRVDFTLGPQTGGERYRVDGTASPENLDLHVVVSGSPVAHLGQAALSGSLRGDLAVRGPPAAPRAEGSVNLDYGRLNAEPLVLSAGVDIARDRMGLRDLSLTLGGHQFTQGRAAVDLGTGSFSAEVIYQAELLRDKVSTRFRLEGEAPGYGVRDVAALRIPDQLRATLTVSEAVVDGVPFPGWDVRIGATAEGLSFTGGPRSVVGGSLGRDGRLSLSFRDPFPLVATLEGTVERGRLALDLAVRSFDLAALDQLISSDVIHFEGGTAFTPALGKIRIQGPMNDPDLVGSLRVLGARIRTPLSPEAATPVDTWLHFGPSSAPGGDGKSFLLDKVTSPMGKGRVTAAARFTMDHWSPKEFELTLTAEPPQGVHLVWRFGSLVVDGYASGTIRVVHDGVNTRVSSENLTVMDSKLAMDFNRADDEEADKGEGGRSGPLPLAVDLAIRTGRGVQFVWPNQTLPILKTTARQGSVLRVLYDDSTGELVMNGDVGVLGGSVFFFDRSFSIREGSIAFRENALRFDPRVSLRAEIRERDAENREIRIYLDADRVRLSELSTETIRFSSDPAYSQAAILARLGQSITSRTATAGLDSPVYEGTGALPLIASLTGDVISQLGILSPIEDAVRNVLGLDLVSIRTQLVQNFLIDKALGGDLDNSSPALGKYFGNTELTVGKYIGDDLFLEMMVRLQTAEERLGFAALTGLSPAFEISLEWEMPFEGLVLDWSLLPRHPEDLFLSDNTLGVRWRYRY